MKLIFAADDYKLVRDEHDIIVFVQIEEAGTYYVNFSSKEVRFMENDTIEEYASATLEIAFDDETELLPHTCGTAKYRQCIVWRPRTIVGRLRPAWEVKVECFVGSMGNHDHDDPSIREVYLSAEAPFVGKVCGYGEEHSSWDIFPSDGKGKWVAVKVIPLIRKV